MVELDETVTRIGSHAGVEVVQILNTAGNILVERTNMSTGPSTPSAAASSRKDDDSKVVHNTSASTAMAAKKLLSLAQTYVQSLDAADNDEISFVQIRSAHGRELMIAPHNGFALVVLKRS